MPPSSYSGKAAGSFGALGGDISFEWTPDPEVIAQQLLQLAGYLEDVTAPLALSREVVKEDIRVRFETKTTPDGDPWVEWSESYAPYALQHNIGGILEQTQEMRDAALDEGAYLIDGNSLFYDTSGLPARWSWHQEGKVRHTGGGGISEGEVAAFAQHMGYSHQEAKASLEKSAAEFSGGGNVLPARPFLGLSFEGELRIVELFDQWFDEAIALGVSSKGKVFPRHALRGSGGRFISRG